MFKHLILIFLGIAISFVAESHSHSSCDIKPPFLKIPIQKKGLTWLKGEEFKGECDEVPQKKWKRFSLKSNDLVMNTNGPFGSGRYWNVTVGFAKKKSKPYRGFCFRTNTLGWRTLQNFNNSPLPWIDDLNGDQKPEMIIWSSFTIEQRPFLIAWVYQLDSNRNFVIDWNLTHKFTKQIMIAYQKIVKGRRASFQRIRNKAVKQLKAFVNKKCVINLEHQ
jgi:hypothetical protein